MAEGAESKGAGMAVAALAGSIVAFVNLVGLEKAILALVLALIARKSLAPGSKGRRLTTAAILLCSAYFVIWTGVMTWALYTGKAQKFIGLLHSLN